MISPLLLLAALQASAAAAPPAAAVAATPTAAQTVQAAASGHKVTQLTVYGNDPCPKGNADEIVVCARRPENERYRIPPALRHKKPRPAEGSWTNNAAMLDEIGRQQMVPGSCSVNGINGQTGCTQQMLHQWYQERKQQKAEEAAADNGTATPDDPQ